MQPMLMATKENRVLDEILGKILYGQKVIHCKIML